MTYGEAKPREVGWDWCSHLAFVEGPEMTREQAKKTFQELHEEFATKLEAADKAFTNAFGWYDKPLQGLAQENYHERRREALRKAGCWRFPEFLEARGYRAVDYVDVSIPMRSEIEDDEISKDSPAESSPSAPQAQSSRQTAGDSAESEDPTCPRS